MKLDLILENIRNRYSLGLLEESEGMSEKDLLKGKILINESTMAIRSMLVEEGVIAGVQRNLEEAWSAALIQEFDMDDAQAAFDYANTGSAPEGALNTAADYAAKGVNAVAPYQAVTGAVDQAGQAYDQAQDRIAIDQGKSAINSGVVAASNAVDQGKAAVSNAVDQGKVAVSNAVDQGVSAAKEGLLTPGQAAAGLGWVSIIWWSWS